MLTFFSILAGIFLLLVFAWLVFGRINVIIMIAAIQFLVWLAMVGGIAYVIYHFVSKYW
jgi:hypothetical protein